MKSFMLSDRSWYPICFSSLSLLLLIIVLPLTRHGMFMDGVFYAAIAKNLSLGYGTIWQPFYSQTDFPIFYEHPPLAIYFQSLFFKFLGPGFGVEQLYSFLMALGQFSLISWYWLKKTNTTYLTLGLLLFIWLLIPLNHIYVCNMLEGTLTLFTTFASLILLVRTTTKSAFLAQYTISAIAVLIAFLCNGPTAFFVLVVPFIYEITARKQSIYNGLMKTIFLLLVVSLVFISFYLLVPDARLNTWNYLEQQLLADVTGTRQLNYVGLKHLHVLYLFFRAYWLVSAFAIACIIISAKINGQNSLNNLKTSLTERTFVFFIILSLISSIPVGISHKQAFNYIMQSAPFFTLATIWVCFEPFKIIVAYCRTTSLFKWLFRSSCLFLIVSIITVLSLANGFNRDKAMINDINYLTHNLNDNTVISASHAVYYQWHTSAYLARNSMISITPAIGKQYYLALKNEPIPDEHHKVNLPLSYYNLTILAEDKRVTN